MSLNPVTPPAGPAPLEGHFRQQASRKPKTFRLCVALFNALPDAHLAANQLTHRGVSPADIYALARAEVLTAATAGGESDAVVLFERLSDPLQIVPSAFGVGPCLASPGTLLAEIGVHMSAADMNRPNAADWLSDGQRHRLGSHLERRGLILMVSSATPAQQDLVCLSLLPISQRGIQTHDFTRVI